MWSKLVEKWFNFYYVAEGGPFNTLSLRNMLILTALIYAAHC